MTAGAIVAPTVVPLRIPVPGNVKHVIDSNTPIELKCETSNTEIYYTVDGTKPNPYQRLRYNNTTYKYEQPILLLAGRRVIRAIAVDLKKERESVVVTKTFYVEKASVPNTVPLTNAPSEENEEAKNGTESVDSENDVNSDKSESEPRQSKDGSVGSSLSDEIADENASDDGNATENYSHNSVSDEEFAVCNDRKEVSKIEVVNEHQEEYCHCSTDQQCNEWASFCTSCGKLLNTKREMEIAIPLNVQMGICENCRCQVPTNSCYCIVCEVPFAIRNQQFVTFKEKKICRGCYTVNHFESESCRMCGRSIPVNLHLTKPNVKSKIVPTIVHVPFEYLSCLICGRLNSQSARYCDWCGKGFQLKSRHYLECPLCQVDNKLEANFCQNCGLHFQPPLNNEVAVKLSRPMENKAISVIPIIKTQHAQTDPNVHAVKTQYIQTMLSSCMFPNPFSTKMGKKYLEVLDMKPRGNLDGTSPGRGFWRQQMNHIIVHLKAYAYNNHEFQAQLSKPKLTQIRSAKMQVNTESFTLIITFGMKAISNSAKATENRKFLNKTLLEDDRSATEILWDAIKANKNVNEINSLLTNNVNIRDVDGNGNSVLHIAVGCGNAEVIPLLVESGASIKAKNAEGQSVLHYAILKQEAGLHAVQILLQLGCDTSMKNRQGQDAFQLAVDIDNQAVLRLLSTRLGKQMLEKLTNMNLPNTHPTEIEDGDISVETDDDDDFENET